MYTINPECFVYHCQKNALFLRKLNTYRTRYICFIGLIIPDIQKMSQHRVTLYLIDTVVYLLRSLVTKEFRVHGMLLFMQGCAFFTK